MSTGDLAGFWRYNQGMSIDEIEAEALKLTPQARAKLAGKLLESLDALSDMEVQEVWAEEADRRDADLDRRADDGRPTDDVFREARSKLK